MRRDTILLTAVFIAAIFGNFPQAFAGSICVLLRAYALGSLHPADEPADSEQALLDALRERKLYRLLEVHCRAQLSRSDCSATERARFTIELANILAARAQEPAAGPSRADLWQQASNLLRQFLADEPQHPQAPALEFQLGVYELVQGERLGHEAKLLPEDADRVEAARARLRSAVQSFRSVESQVAQAMKKRHPGDIPGTDQPSFKQLLALSNNNRFRLGQAFLAMAESYPRHSANQTEFAAQAKTQFDAFTQRYSTLDLVLESYLARAECLRLLNDPAEATKSLRELEKPETPDRYLDRSLVLRAQLKLDQMNPAAARGFIEDSRKLLKAPNAELDLLYVQAMVDLAREQAKGHGNLVARQLVSEAVRAIDEIETTHGPYWASRGELLLADLARDNVLVENPGVLARMADGQYRRADRSGAVATLDRAVKLAGEHGDLNQAVDLAFRAASILAESGEADEAARRFAGLASTYSNHPRAPQAQFMAAYCLGQAYVADRTRERLARYELALEQHLRTFRDDETASEARWLLGSLRLSERRWSDAIELWKGVSLAHPRSAAARQGAAQAYEGWLLEIWSRSGASENVATEAIAYLNGALVLDRRTEFATDDIPMALRLVRILVHPTVAYYEKAEGLLERILFGPAANESERAEARRLSVVALLGQDKFDAAARMLDTEFVDAPQELFAAVQALEDAAGRSSTLRRRRIGRLQLGATERLVKEAQELTPEQSLQAEIYLALAYVNAGEANRAEELFAKLRDRAPNNPRVLQAQADCYMQLGRYAQARDNWRQLVGAVRENTPLWFHAKYNLALACFRSGDPKQCQKIIQVTGLLHPDLGGPELKAKFEDLNAKCQAE